MYDLSLYYRPFLLSARTPCPAFFFFKFPLGFSQSYLKSELRKLEIYPQMLCLFLNLFLLLVCFLSSLLVLSYRNKLHLPTCFCQKWGVILDASFFLCHISIGHLQSKSCYSPSKTCPDSNLLPSAWVPLTRRVNRTPPFPTLCPSSSFLQSILGGPLKISIRSYLFSV